MTPEKRADRDIAEYIEAVNFFATILAPYAVTEAQRAEASVQLEEYRLAYLRWTNTLWASKSRTASPMITGPARFPVERNRKAMDAEMKKINLFLGWLPKAKARAIRAIQAVDAPAKVKPEGQPENTTETIGAVQIVTNYDAERIQLIFPGKPDDETRAKLKGAGWNWSPSNAAWQRKITPATMRSARQIAGGA